MYHGIKIIAEVKTQSPFGFRSAHTWDELFAVANRVGDMISIHTDPRWGGSFDLIKKACTMTNKPILAKGIHASDGDIERALAAGADWVLVVGRVPSTHIEKCLIEPNTIQELADLPAQVRAVWNSRDLQTGKRKKESFAEARSIFSGWMCQASLIGSIDDVHSEADAVLVGERLKEFAVSCK
ncbi:MAG: hypothetical protein AAB343_00990 [Patescibacteria group bacterium]